MLNFETGELTDSPRKINVNSAYSDVPAGAKIVLNHQSQVSTYNAGSYSRIDFFPRQEVGGQSNGLSHHITLFFSTSDNKIRYF